MSMKKYFLLFTLSFFVLLSPGEVMARQDVKETLDTYIETFLADNRIPGASVGIAYHDEIFYANAWGITGEGKKEVTTETPFLIGSISKAFTGLAVLKLIEEERLALDDPIVKHLPWFTLNDQEDASQITIKQLLTHTSGLSRSIGLLIADRGNEENNTIKKGVKKLANVKLTEKPGEIYQYSDANYLILGALIEHISGISFSDYLNHHIFLPLDMNQAGADRHKVYEKGYAAGYQSWFGMPVNSQVPYDNGGTPYGYIAASTEDILKFLMVFNSGHEQSDILSNRSKKAYLSPLTQVSDKSYGFGWRFSNQDKEDKSIWHAGSTPDSRTEVFMYPETKWSGVILTNKNHILEEEQLTHLKEGIIRIINGHSPAEVSKSRPIIQLLLSFIVCLLFILSCYLIGNLKKRHRKTPKLRFRIFGILCLSISICLIPLFVMIVQAPWHSVTVFAADLVLILKVIVFLLALNGLLLVMNSFVKGKREKVT